ncbi:MAG: type II toxin-antitoxin system HicA family toxin [Armatimonadota bacterium]
MRLPRDISGRQLALLLGRVGYVPVRQAGSHLRLSRKGAREHHITIPLHDPLRVGTVAGILADVAEHLGMSREELVETLFGS